MPTINAYIKNVSKARQQFIQEASGLSHQQANFKPTPEAWSICQITEHIVWAEQIGINRMWQAVDGVKNNKPIWQGEPIHHGLSIEEIIESTWKAKEKVPEVAKPVWGGPIDFWIASLKACQGVLESLGEQLHGLNPAEIIYPHPISGPMNLWQRLDFLRFHLQRHQAQIKRVKATVGYDS